MNPKKVRRASTRSLTDLPNVGPAIAKILNSIGIDKPSQLEGCDPVELYERLYKVTGKWEDPCILDTFISIVRFIDGEEAQVWWAFTAERKRLLESKVT
jgi:hypothetical protein